jgi:NitT/TauT family transport system substrate-binding protein
MIIKKRTRKGFVFVLATALIFLFVLPTTSCSKAVKNTGEEKPAAETEGADQVPDLGKASFRMKWVPYGNYAGDLVGEKWGIWKKHGLDVKVNSGGPGIITTQMVASGSDEFGSTGPDELAIAIAKGLPLVAIAAEMQITPIGYFVHPDSGIHSPADFAGKRFRVIPGHNSFYEYQILMKKFGIDRSTVTEVVNKSAYQLWLAHKVDIDPSYNNLASTHCDHRNIPYRLIRSIDFGVTNYGNILFTTKKMAQENPEAVKVFIKGFFEAWHATWADPGRAIDTIMKYDPSLKKEEEMEIAMEVRPYMERTDGRWGWMEYDRWKEQLDTFFDVGIIEKKLTPEDIFTNRFCEELYGKPDKPLGSGFVLPPHEQKQPS